MHYHSCCYSISSWFSGEGKSFIVKFCIIHLYGVLFITLCSSVFFSPIPDTLVSIGNSV